MCTSNKTSPGTSLPLKDKDLQLTMAYAPARPDPPLHHMTAHRYLLFALHKNLKPIGGASYQSERESSYHLVATSNCHNSPPVATFPPRLTHGLLIANAVVAPLCYGKQVCAHMAAPTCATRCSRSYRCCRNEIEIKVCVYAAALASARVEVCWGRGLLACVASSMHSFACSRSCIYHLE